MCRCPWCREKTIRNREKMFMSKNSITICSNCKIKLKRGNRKKYFYGILVFLAFLPLASSNFIFVLGVCFIALSLHYLSILLEPFEIVHNR